MKGVNGKEVVQTLPIGKEQLRRFVEILQKYKTGKAYSDRRVVAAENWWKLRNRDEIEKDTNEEDVVGFKSQSAWLHNVIVSKHADACEAYPEPILLPREEADKAEAQKLSSILPCIFEQNDFENTYSEVMWQKMKTGTGIYKVFWDQNKLNGLGDISIEKVSQLNVFYEPGITDIQKSPFFFHTELHSKELLESEYPQLQGKLKSTGFVSTKFLYDDTVDTSDKATVIEVYYKRRVNGRTILHYCKFVDDNVLFATENQTQPEVNEMGQVMKEPMAVTGLYDHGKYPYVFDALFPFEGSPCGYGFVDICRNPQTQADLLNTAFVKNARVGAVPRYFSRIDGNVKEEEFLDLNKTIVHVKGSVDDTQLRKIDHNNLDGNYIAMLDRTIDQLRQTSGNTEAATGQTPSGVTTASGIAALQEASGKGSRDSTKNSWRAFSQVTEITIELVRQFYDMPRQFRIIGEQGQQVFATYSNAGLQPQHQGNALGMDMGYRLPVFDIKISAQKKNVYTKLAQNELAIQLYKLGVFNPQMATQVLPMLEMMDFDGKDKLVQTVSQNGNLFQKLVFYMQLAASMADPQMQQEIMQEFATLTGSQMPAVGGQGAALTQAKAVSSEGSQEHGVVRNARERSQNASQPDGGKGVSQ